MAWLWRAFGRLQDHLASPAPRPVTSFHPQLTQLNDYVYEVCKPAGRPSMEIIFLHGLQLDGFKKDFITTWLSRDGSELWPKWIAKRFPEARILLVSYDGSAGRKDDQGCTDMYITGENLVHSLIDEAAQVGRDGCPVVLVGHCLGGLVIKEFLLRANSMLGLATPDDPHEYVQCLLESVKELFFYATPHHGSRFADIETHSAKGLLVECITTLNKEAARCNEDFRKLRQRNRWRASGIAESLPVTLGTFNTQFVVRDEASGNQLFVEEASTRSDVDTLYTVQAHHFDVCRPESIKDSSFCKLIDVVDRASKEDVPGHKMYFSSEVVGLDDQVEIVKKSLQEARRLGIVGTGGMGKSTLAKAVYNSISKDFEYTCFLSNVKNSVGKTETVEVLQERILENLHYKGRRKMVQWSRLKGKKNLFIFDDVEYASQVYARLDDFAYESCVLVTSRDRRFVRSMDFEVHDAIVLDDKASSQLFCLHAFKGADTPEVYKRRVALFIEKCGGLPLALEVTGKYLFTENREGVWDDAFNRLSHAQALDGNEDDELWSIVKVIYASLAEAEKQMFLDIAVCFHGDELESVKRAWRVCSWAKFSADAGWKNLLDKGLVTMTPFLKRKHHGTWTEGKWTEDGCIQMHEVLRDLGCSIACTNAKINQNSTRVCYDGFNQRRNWPFNQGKPNFQVRVLKIVSNGGKDHPRPKIDIETISGLDKLEILWLDGVNLSGSRNLTFFPDNLAFLKLRRCDWRDKYYFERLFAPVFNKYKVEGSSSGREISSQKVAEHPTLRHFEIEGFHDLYPLVDTLGLGTRGEVQALKDLKFEGHPDGLPCVQALPETFEQHRHIKIDDYVINISRCSGLEAPTKCLTISGCWLTTVPGNVRGICHLRSLVISRCPYLVTLPEVLRNLVNLEISYCNLLEALPESFGRRSTLQRVVISNCPVLRRLPDTFGELTVLEHLEISYCDSLEALPDIMRLLWCLRHFEISNCPRLRRLPDTFGELVALEHLEISYCHSLETLSDFIGPRPRLPGLGTLGELVDWERLEISYCHLLEAPSGIMGPRWRLRHFKISNCPVLRRLPDTFGELTALEHLEISYCDSLEALPDIMRPLRRLRHFEISNCPGLRRLPDTFGGLPALEHLEISYCKLLKALPKSFELLSELRHFKISNCPGLYRLPDALGELPALELLEISFCHSLEALPDTIGRLRGLQDFMISNCPGLRRLPDTLGELPALERLEISYCHSLKALPDIMGPLRGLRHFIISNCSGLHRLPDNLGELPALERVEISDCYWLEALPDTIGSLRRLQHFTISNCPRLDRLPDVANLRRIEPQANVEEASTSSALEEDVPGHKMCFSSEVVGLDDQVEAVKRALKIARRLWIAGEEGVGKSTLAKAVYNSIAGEFEYTCFLRNVDRFLGNAHGTVTMEMLQEKTLGSLHYKGRWEMMNWSRLKGKKSLFIFDDIGILDKCDFYTLHESDFYRFLKGFSDESLVLITSMDTTLALYLGYEVYCAEPLDPDTSNRLFCLHAFKGADVPDVYRHSVWRIVDKCRGVPLFLEVTGKYLSTQKVGVVWDDTLDKLTKDERSMFKVVYDSLAEDEKQMFLNTVICFHGEKLESVKRAWRACCRAESSADAGWQKLLDLGLITMTPLSETDPDATWMDDMWIEDGYIQIHKSFESLGFCEALDRRIFCQSIEGHRQLKIELVDQPMSDVRILKIVKRSSEGMISMDIQQLRGLEKLEILWLDGVYLDGACNMLPVNLKFLKMKRCLWRGGSVSSISEELREHPTLRHFEFEEFDQDVEYIQYTRGRHHTLGQLQVIEI